MKSQMSTPLSDLDKPAAIIDVDEVLRDILLLVGLGLLGYGLWMYQPWIAYAVVGAVMVAIAVGSALIKSKGVSNAG